MFLSPYPCHCTYLLKSSINGLKRQRDRNGGTVMGWDRNGHGAEVAGPKCHGLLPTAWRKLYDHSSLCGASVHRRMLTSPSIASFSSCSVLVGPLLPNLHHCSTVLLYTSCYRAIENSSFSKDDNLPSFKLSKLFEFLLLPSRRHT